MFGRVRIDRPHNHGPRLACACLLALVLSVLGNLSGPVTQFYWQWDHMDIPLYPLMLGSTTLVACFLITRDCQHQRWWFLTGALSVCTALVVSEVLDPFGLRGCDIAERVSQLPLKVFLLGVLGGTMGLGMARLTHLVFARALAPSGPACPGCGYDVRQLPQPRCPECGRQLTPDDLSPSAPPVLREWRRFAMVTAIVVAVSAGVYLSYPYVLIPAWIRGWAPSDCVEAYFGIHSACSEKLLAEYVRSGNDHQRAMAVCQVGWLCRVFDERRVAGDATVDLVRYSVLNDPVPRVRKLAAQSLGFIDRDLLFDLLPDMVLDSDATVRWIALAMASTEGHGLDPRGMPFLIRALDDPDPTVRSNVYRRLRDNTRGISLPFDPNGPREQRLAEQAVWQAWWDDQSNLDPAAWQGWSHD